MQPDPPPSLGADRLYWLYRETLQPWLIACLLTLKDMLPRSLAS